MQEQARWAQKLTAGTSGHEGHMDNIEIARILYDAWQAYFVEGVGYSAIELFGDDSAGRPIVKSIAVRYDGEVFPGLDLVVEVRATGRRNRSFTLEQVLRRADDSRVLAVGTVALVTIDVATTTPVAIPEPLWAAIEKFEGRSIPAEATA